MRRTWTIIGVGDVAGSFKWYQSLLGLPETAPAHDDFGQILDSDGTVLLCFQREIQLSLRSCKHFSDGVVRLHYLVAKGTEGETKGKQRAV
jgi:hypothetical protein